MSVRIKCISCRENGEDSHIETIEGVPDLHIGTVKEDRSLDFQVSGK